jgi:hypothetical protein
MVMEARSGIDFNYEDTPVVIAFSVSPIVSERLLRNYAPPPWDQTWRPTAISWGRRAAALARRARSGFRSGPAVRRMRAVARGSGSTAGMGFRVEPPDRPNSCYRSSQVSSRRQPLKMLFTIIVSPLTRGCMHVAPSR